MYTIRSFMTVICSPADIFFSIGQKRWPLIGQSYVGRCYVHFSCQTLELWRFFSDFSYTLFKEKGTALEPKHSYHIYQLAASRTDIATGIKKAGGFRHGISSERAGGRAHNYLSNKVLLIFSNSRNRSAFVIRSGRINHISYFQQEFIGLKRVLCKSPGAIIQGFLCPSMLAITI